MIKGKWYITDGTKWAAYAGNGMPSSGASVLVGDRSLAYAFETKAEADAEKRRCKTKFAGLGVRKVTVQCNDPLPTRSSGWVITNGREWATYKNCLTRSGARVTDNEAEACVYDSQEDVEYEYTRHKGQFYMLSVKRVFTEPVHMEEELPPAVEPVLQPVPEPSVPEEPENTGWVLTNGKSWAVYKHPESLTKVRHTFVEKDAHIFQTKEEAENERTKHLKKYGKYYAAQANSTAHPQPNSNVPQAGWYLTHNGTWGAYTNGKKQKGSYITWNTAEAYPFEAKNVAEKAAKRKKKFCLFTPVWVEPPVPEKNIPWLQADLPASGDIPANPLDPDKRKQFTKKERRDVYRKTEGHCYMCGDFVDFESFEIDHYFPLSHGGPNTMDNLWCSCHACNHLKGCHDPEVFFPLVMKIAAHQEKPENAGLPGCQNAKSFLPHVEKIAKNGVFAGKQMN